MGLDYKLDDAEQAAQNFMQWFCTRLLFKNPGEGEQLYKDAEETLKCMFLSPWEYQNGEFRSKKWSDR